MAKRALEGGATDEDRYARFRADVDAYLSQVVPAEEVASLEFVGDLEFSWRGLARYWKKRGVGV